MDGGCLVFANSLKNTFDKIKIDCELYVVGRIDHLDHIILKTTHPKYGEIFIDAAGIASKQEIMDKMIFIEQLPSDNIDCLSVNNKNVLPIPEDYGRYQNKEAIYNSSSIISKAFIQLIKKNFLTDIQVKQP